MYKFVRKSRKMVETASRKHSDTSTFLFTKSASKPIWKGFDAKVWSKWFQIITLDYFSVKMVKLKLKFPKTDYTTNSNQQLFVSYILKYILIKTINTHFNKIFHVNANSASSNRVNLRVSSLMIPFARMINSTTGSCYDKFPKAVSHDSNNIFSCLSTNMFQQHQGFF